MYIKISKLIITKNKEIIILFDQHDCIILLLSIFKKNILFYKSNNVLYTLFYIIINNLKIFLFLKLS
jgi:hypothetical protein